jgi:hypothetical protein
VILQAEFVRKLLEVGLDNEHVVSLNEKPLPTTATYVPVRPDGGLMEILGAWTVNVVCTWTPPPVTVIVYGPGSTVATTKLPVKLPPVDIITQLDVLTGEPDIEQVVAVELSDPVTLTVDPRAAVVGFTLIAVTVNVVWAFMKLAPEVAFTITV